MSVKGIRTRTGEEGEDVRMQGIMYSYSKLIHNRGQPRHEEATATDTTKTLAIHAYTHSAKQCTLSLVTFQGDEIMHLNGRVKLFHTFLLVIYASTRTNTTDIFQ